MFSCLQVSTLHLKPCRTGALSPSDWHKHTHLDLRDDPGTWQVRALDAWSSAPAGWPAATGMRAHAAAGTEGEVASADARVGSY